MKMAHTNKHTHKTFVTFVNKQLILFNDIPKFLCMCVCVCSGFGGLEVACWPLVPEFAGSNPAEAVGKKSLVRLPSEGK
jgi:hypothetical protein